MNAVTALLLTATLALGACGPTQVALDAVRGDRIPEPAHPTELFSGDTGQHTWAIVSGDSPQGPVLQTYRDGELQGSSWGWLDTRTFESPLDVSAGVPHTDADDIDSPLLDHLQGYARTHASVDEVVLYLGAKIVGRWEPVPHPAADFSVAPAIASRPRGDERFWMVACRAGEPVATHHVWSPVDGSFSAPSLDPCSSG